MKRSGTRSIVNTHFYIFLLILLNYPGYRPLKTKGARDCGNQQSVYLVLKVIQKCIQENFIM